MVRRLVDVEESLGTTNEQLDDLAKNVDPNSNEGKEVQTLQEKVKTAAKEAARQIGAAAFNTGKEVASEKVAEIKEVAAKKLQEKAGQLADKVKGKTSAFLANLFNKK